ncbi:PTS system mannose/fructose/N-acetylgalactosamine-transporter subunit IIB [Xylocopilactobacillus apis]|uniref:PTS sorbose transporter subunit IIB n=1 Tax=Xylocopilactobacillus apis TaxID=2932183 RepID=A0AAU9DMS3_9LACO|nr:PTS sugar transporter subunit IIB [Xylocopilactobacillus apis]BDR56974.1 PTS sorbose transporter subunit IIB [Xylocopilactobacillus apis]
MISLMRIDDRLIHGQVAVVWSRYLGVNRIVVANDEVINNQMQMMALKMSVPDGIRPFFVSVNKSIDLLNNPKSKSLKILVIVDKPLDALKIAKNVTDIPLINLGNYGRVNGEKMKEKKQLSKNVFINKNDELILHQLLDVGIKVNVQPIPTDADINLKEIL